MSKEMHTLIPESATEEVDLTQLIGVLLDGRYLIIVITLLSTLITVALPRLSAPVYRADALIQLEKEKNNSFFPELMAGMAMSAPLSLSEMTLIKSRSVLSKTVSEFGLDISVVNKEATAFNRLLAMFSEKKEEVVTLSRFDVPEYFYKLPFELTILEKGKFQLLAEDYKLTGDIGKLNSHDGVSIMIESTEIKPGTQFILEKTDEADATAKLLQRLTVADVGSNSGMLTLTLSGGDKNNIVMVLNSIMNNYISQNIARNSEVASKSLNFLQAQVPKVKKQLEEAEGRLNAYRESHDSMDISLETKLLLDNSILNSTQLNELALEEATVSEKYKVGHPLYKVLKEKRATLLKKKRELETKIDIMPKTQQEIMRLTRDVHSGNEIYMFLLSKQQELNITEASEIGNARVIDPAVVDSKPVRPGTVTLLMLGAIAGFSLSSVLLFLWVFLKRHINSSEQLSHMGLNVLSEIPYARRMKKNKTGLLVLKEPHDLTTEAIRSLRTSLYFTMKLSQNKTIMVSGPDRGVGKSFLSGNLGVAFSQSGLRVLLIDADMRLGYLHDLLEVPVGLGLSEFLSGSKTLSECVTKTKIDKLDFVSRGGHSENPSELLLTAGLAELLSYANENYDIVLIDSPPVLRVSDAIIIAKHAGTRIMVTRFGFSKQHEVSTSIARFEQADCRIHGVVLNAIKRRASHSLQGTFYGYSEYYGESKKKK